MTDIVNPAPLNPAPLDPIALPLNKNALIEASAGTGKTYTITTLYLRALLGLTDGKQQGELGADENSIVSQSVNEQSGLTPLTVEQILVVTFTEAATQEIRDRVRAKLKQVQDQILGIDEQADPVIETLLNEYTQRFLQEKRQQQLASQTGSSTDPQTEPFESDEQSAALNAYHVLQNAITLIDEASIFTIHGFCHRCLKQFAFETNASFEQNFEMDAKPTLYNALLDFWRKHVVELQHAEFDWFASFWKSPDALYKDLASVIGKDVTFEPKVSENEYQALIREYQEVLVRLKKEWLASKFSDVLTSSKLSKSKNTYKRIPMLQEFMSSDRWLPEFGDNKVSWALWGTESLATPSNYTKNAEVIQHSITAIVDELSDIENRLKQGSFKSHWLQTAKQYIESRAKQLKTEQQIINPDDLLLELASAISNPEAHISNHDSGSATDNAANNLALINAITQRYPLAFIDEFQDTDPTQYKIFSALYGDHHIATEQDSTADSGTDTGKEISSANMILIGDPKQAIYKFRGADIFTYIQAKQDIPATQHYTLDKNWRSHPYLVTAVNYVFAQNEQGFRNIHIPFINVGAAKSADKRVQINKHKDANIEFWHLTPGNDASLTEDETATTVGFKKDEGEALMAKWAAKDIANTLHLAASGKAGFIDGKTSDTGGRPIKSNDICVLVRNRLQANIMKKALSKLGVSSVFISTDNIFESDLAKDILRLLNAIESPFNEQKVRSACAGSLFGYTADQLLYIADQSAQSEQFNQNQTSTSANANGYEGLPSWQQHLAVFQQSNTYWQKGQIAKAFNVILQFAHTFNVWQQDTNLDAERLITDFRHLTELVQQESVKISGSQKLLLWFEKQVTATDAWSNASDEQQLRLESDNQLVQIATLHASKGLEYPIVYLPFICDYREEKTALYNSNKAVDGLSQGSQGLTYRVDNRLLEQQIAEEERLAEDIRLLYVAMTRPVYKLVIGMYDLRNQYKKSQLALSAAGQLILGNQLGLNDNVGDKKLDDKKSDTINDELIANVCQQFSFEINAQADATASKYICATDNAVTIEYLELTDKELAAPQSHSTMHFSPFKGNIPTDWRMLSYSSLAAQHHSSHATAHSENQSSGGNSGGNSGLTSDVEQTTSDADLTWLPGVSDEVGFSDALSASDTEQNQQIELSPFNFPKGANAGSCLHWIMENLDFCQPIDLQKDAIETGLERFGLPNIWVDTTTEWLQQVINCPLDNFALLDISDDKKLVEMEFYFGFNALNSTILSNALLMCGVTEPQVNKELSYDNAELSGILKGFIDLTVMHNGKYYVLDYKSNYLGEEISDYGQDSLQVCMSDHSYYLQAVIYAFALHRFLKQRLPDYDYDQHVGGALYLFLRGMHNWRSEQIQSVESETNSKISKIADSEQGVFHMNVKYEVIQYLENALEGSVDNSDPNAAIRPNDIKANDIQESKEQESGQPDKQSDSEAASESNSKTTDSNNASGQMGFGFE